MNLMNQEEMQSRLFEYLSTREWWAIPLNTHAMTMVEERYYAGDANKDFHLVIGSLEGKIFSIAFAHKRHMTPIQVGEVFGTIPGGEQDILLAIDDEFTPKSLMEVATWLGGIYNSEKSSRN